jgi:hypothetical protein
MENMQHIVLTIKDRAIERAMAEIAQHEGMSPQEVVMQAIRAFIQQTSPSGRQFDPFRHSTPVHYVVTEDLTDVTPYASVTDSAQFGRTLRNDLWGRTSHG